MAITRRQPSIRMVCVAIIMLSFLSSGLAFTMKMGYKPPVKSSVNTLSNARSRSLENLPSSKNQAMATGAMMEQMQDISLGSRVKALVMDKLRRRPLVQVVQSIEEFKSIVGDEKENFVAVMFHAEWCKACKAVAPRFYKLAKKYPTVKFVDVPVTEATSSLLKGLGVEKFPFGHIYHPSQGLVDERPILRRLIPDFEEKLRSFLNLGNDNSEDDYAAED